MKQKRYNQEFKQTIVDLYRSGTSVSDLSREYGVSEVTIYNMIHLVLGGTALYDDSDNCFFLI